MNQYTLQLRKNCAYSHYIESTYGPALDFCIPAVARGKLAAQRGLEVEAEQIPEQLRWYLPTELVTMSHP
jgi:hypothetical protein